MKKALIRVFTGIFLIGLLVLCLHLGDIVFLLIFGAFFLITVREMDHLIKAMGKEIVITPASIFAGFFGIVYYLTSYNLSVVFAFGLLMVARFAMPAFRRVFKKYDRLNESIEENVRGMRVVKGFSRENYEREKFHVASEDICKDFEENLDWTKWVCVAPSDAMTAVKDNMVLCLMAADANYTQTAAGITAAGWTTVNTLTNPMQ